MAERRRRSVYRTKAVEEEDTSPQKPIIDSTTSPESGFKRPRNGSNLENREMDTEQMKDERVRKVRHTISGSEKALPKEISEMEHGNKSRSSKHRKTVDFSQGSHDNASEAAKPEEKSKSRKSTTRQSASSLIPTETNALLKEKQSKSATSKDTALSASKPTGKGKGRAVDPIPREPAVSSSDQGMSSAADTNSKGKGKAKAVLPSVPDYEVPSDSNRLHGEVPTDMPEPRRLQRLLELAVEAEQAQMSRLYTGEFSWISRFAHF